ncbi:anti-sigma factor [Paraconexibacter sp.]|uniref:anti-sigma factor family protein n=1 Tax=Paraconexibacter sp. TaxID=2949640 RepID=UPI003564F791
MITAMLRHPFAFRRDHRFTMEHASEFLDGDLPPDELARVEGHAHACPMCARFLASLRRTVRAIGGLRHTPAGADADAVTEAVLARLRAEDDAEPGH